MRAELVAPTSFAPTGEFSVVGEALTGFATVGVVAEGILSVEGRESGWRSTKERPPPVEARRLMCSSGPEMKM